MQVLVHILMIGEDQNDHIFGSGQRAQAGTDAHVLLQIQLNRATTHSSRAKSAFPGMQAQELLDELI